jgi:hypothetical protein
LHTFFAVSDGGTTDKNSSEKKRMPEARSGAAARTLVPSAAESGTTAIRRVRLAKALAAKPSAKISDMSRPPKPDGANATKAKKRKPGPRRYKLADEEYAQLTALKRRLETLGSSIRRSELLRAGLLVLVAMNDDQLKRAVASVSGVGPVTPLQQAA